MNLKELKQNYEKAAKKDPLEIILAGNKKDLNEFFETGENEIKEIISYLDKLGLSVGKIRALDFGCGIGRLSRALTHHFKEVHGVDISENMISLAKQHNKYDKKCMYHANSAPDLRIFPDNFFDFIYSNITLQHIPRKYSLNYVKEFLRVLKPRGIIIFQLPSQRVKKEGENKLIFLIKDNLLKILPETIINLYKKRKWGFTVNMYPIKKAKVISFIGKNNGKIVDIVANNWGGKRHNSLRYCVMKKRELES